MDRTIIKHACQAAAGLQDSKARVVCCSTFTMLRVWGVELQKRLQMVC